MAKFLDSPCTTFLTKCINSELKLYQHTIIPNFQQFCQFHCFYLMELSVEKEMCQMSAQDSLEKLFKKKEFLAAFAIWVTNIFDFKKMCLGNILDGM